MGGEGRRQKGGIEEGWGSDERESERTGGGGEGGEID